MSANNNRKYKDKPVDSLKEMLDKMRNDMKEMARHFDQRNKILDHTFEERRKERDKKIAELDAESDKRFKVFLESRKASNLRIEECKKRIVLLDELHQKALKRLNDGLTSLGDDGLSDLRDELNAIIGNKSGKDKLQ